MIYVLFVAYLFWRERELIKANWKGLALFFGVAALVAAPLFIYLAAHPGAETARAFQTEPIRALFSGNFAPVIETATATLKMFTFEGGGDPQILYNLTGRPIFIGLGSLLFVIGLLVSVIRFKRPAYAFMLIWLAVTLLPNLVTAPAPFFYRAIATQTPVVVMPAIATVALGELGAAGRRFETIVVGAGRGGVGRGGFVGPDGDHDVARLLRRVGQPPRSALSILGGVCWHCGCVESLERYNAGGRVRLLHRRCRSDYFRSGAQSIGHSRALVRCARGDHRCCECGVQRLALPSYTPLAR